MAETVFLQESTVLVTDKRFVVGGTLYALANVTRCQTLVRHVTEFDENATFDRRFRAALAGLKWTAVAAVLVTLFGGFFGFFPEPDTVPPPPRYEMPLYRLIVSLFFGVAATISTVKDLKVHRKFDLYIIGLSTTAGEQQVIESPDRDFIERIATAINLAIIHRA